MIWRRIFSNAVELDDFSIRIICQVRFLLSGRSTYFLYKCLFFWPQWCRKWFQATLEGKTSTSGQKMTSIKNKGNYTTRSNDFLMRITSLWWVLIQGKSTSVFTLSMNFVLAWSACVCVLCSQQIFEFRIELKVIILHRWFCIQNHIAVANFNCALISMPIRLATKNDLRNELKTIISIYILINTRTCFSIAFCQKMTGRIQICAYPNCFWIFDYFCDIMFAWKTAFHSCLASMYLLQSSCLRLEIASSGVVFLLRWVRRAFFRARLWMSCCAAVPCRSLRRLICFFSALLVS